MKVQKYEEWSYRGSGEMPKADILAIRNAFKSILKYLITNVTYPSETVSSDSS